MRAGSSAVGRQDAGGGYVEHNERHKMGHHEPSVMPSSPQQTNHIAGRWMLFIIFGFYLPVIVFPPR